MGHASASVGDMIAGCGGRELACLTKTDSEAVMSGKIQFSTDFL